MHPRRWGLFAVVLLAAALFSPATPTQASRPAQPSQAQQGLSPYWGSAITQWEPIILEEAERRGLDPDLIAAVMWKESLGRSTARGPAGAVGLMMVMPREAGFSWRPTIAQLTDPATNVFWGARALSIIIKQGHGDLYQALSAYNGGWDQIHLSGPNIYATDIIETYARAVAMRYGVSPEGAWVATVAPANTVRVLVVTGPQRGLARYTQRPIMADLPGVTVEGPPSTIAFEPIEDVYANCRVGVWLTLDGQVLGRSHRSGADAAGAPPPYSVPDEWSLILLLGMTPALHEGGLLVMSAPRREQKGAQ